MESRRRTLLTTVLKDESDTMAISPFFAPRYSVRDHPSWLSIVLVRVRVCYARAGCQSRTDLGRSTRLAVDVPLGASSRPEDDEDEAARVKESEAF